LALVFYYLAAASGKETCSSGFISWTTPSSSAA
jgi:hypothetical protein